MPIPSPQALIQRAPELTVRLSGANAILEVGGLERSGGPHALAILEVFCEPCTLQEGLRRLQPRVLGAEDWRKLVATVLALQAAGILREAGRIQEPGTRGVGSTSAATHIRMLNDRARVDAYLRAIRETVTPEDIVLDIGTGTGVLAVGAALAGARHVYAVEASPMGRAAEAVFAANGVADRITLIQGWSTEINLPQRADVLVAEIIGNDPLAERVMATTRDAQRRLLVPNARLVPHHLTLYGQVVQIPEGVLALSTFRETSVSEWREAYGIDFSPLLREPVARPPAIRVAPQHAVSWTRLSPPVMLAKIDLAAKPDAVPSRTTIAASALTDGTVDGVLVSFELDLAPGATISTHPGHAAPENHWQCMVWLLPEPFQVAAGTRLEFDYCLAGRSQGRASVKLLE